MEAPWNRGDWENGTWYQTSKDDKYTYEVWERRDTLNLKDASQRDGYVEAKCVVYVNTDTGEFKGVQVDIHVISKMGWLNKFSRHNFMNNLDEAKAYAECVMALCQKFYLALFEIHREFPDREK